MPESEMRRSFMTLLGGVASRALSAGAQQPAKVARIGWIKPDRTER